MYRKNLLFLFIIISLLSCSYDVMAAKLGKSNLFIRKSGDPSLNYSAEVGEIITVEIYIEGKGELITGLAAFLTFDDKYLELVPAAMSEGRPIPFRQGGWMQGTVHNNDSLGDAIGNSLQNGIPNFQVYYFENTQRGFGGDQRVAVGNGPIAYMNLRVIKKPAGGNTTIRLNQISPVGSESGYFLRDDPGNTYRFSVVRNLQVTVTGLDFSVELPDLTMLPGEVDSSLDLDEYVSDPFYPDSVLTWTVSLPRPDRIQVVVDSLTHIAKIIPWIGQSAESFIGVSTVAFTVENPVGEGKTDSIQIIVDTPPVFVSGVNPDTVRFSEDGDTTITLTALDPDSGASLRFRSLNNTLNIFSFLTDGVVVSADTTSKRVTLTAKQNFFGKETQRFEISDQFGLTDTINVVLEVMAVNDPPEFTKRFPEISIGALGQTVLNLAEFIQDIDDKFQLLQVSFSGADSIAFDVANDNSRMTITSVPPFIGTRTANIVISDTSNSAIVEKISVQVLPPENPQPPVLLVPLLNIGLRSGSAPVLVNLDSLVTDLDTPVERLKWMGNLPGLVQVDSSALENRILKVSAAPDSLGFIASQLIVTDPTGLTANLKIRFYVSSSITGTPVAGGFPEIELTAGRPDTINLNDYYFDADNDHSEMEWTVTGTSDSTILKVSVDPITNQAILEASEKTNAEIIFTVSDRTGNSASDSTKVNVLDLGSVFIDLGVIGEEYTVTQGAPDTLLIDSVLVVGQKEKVVWEVQPNDNSLLFTQFVVPEQGVWDQQHLLLIGIQTGVTSIFVTATDTSSGISATDSLQVFIQADSSLLKENQDTLFVIDIGPLTLEAERDTTIDLKSLVISGDLKHLVWTSTENPNIEVEIDSILQTVNFRPIDGFLGDAGELIFQVRDLKTEETFVSTASPVEVLPGIRSDFKKGLLMISVVANPVRRNFLDVFVISKRTLLSDPFLVFRVGVDQASKQKVIPVNEVAQVANMWVGDLVLNDQITGQLELSVTGITQTTKVGLTDTLRLQIENANVRSAFFMSSQQITLSLPEGGVSKPSIIAIIPERVPPRRNKIATNPKDLKQASETYLVYAPTAEVKKKGEIQFNYPSGVRIQTGQIGVYWWEEASDQWKYTGSKQGVDKISGSFPAFGRYGLFEDDIAPVLGELNIFPEERVLTISVEEMGSGVDPRLVVLTMNNQQVPATFKSEEGKVVWRPGEELDMGGGLLKLTLADLAGNESVWERQVNLSDLVSGPVHYALHQNFPNPFNPETMIKFELPIETKVRLSVFNMLGQEVRTLVSERMGIGRYSFSWDAKDAFGRSLAAGIYLYRLETSDVVFIKKMVLLK